MISTLDLKSHPKTKFTCDTVAPNSDQYFIESSDKIHFFFEPDAFKDGVLMFEKETSINKIGHGLHIKDQLFKEFSTSQRIIDIARDLEFKKPLILQSMVIAKQPIIGGEVTPHQDSTFLYTNPVSAVGFWFALEDCTIENGCMSFAPGSHKRYPIKRRFINTELGTKFVDLPVNDRSEPADDDYVLAETKKGSLVLIHGGVYHKSGYNHSSKSRFIYTFHLIDGQYEYDNKNWLQTDERFEL